MSLTAFLCIGGAALAADIRTGNAPTNESSLLGLTTPLTSVTRLSAGSAHTCAGQSGGSMKCWGDNVYAQVGDGTDIERTEAVAVLGLSAGVQSVAAGGSHTCAVANAAARCWAYNYFGQVGDGSDTDRDLPTVVTGLASGVRSIATGMNHSCALTSAGGVRCWGANGFGQVGDGSDSNRLTAVNVSGLTSGVQSIAAGGEHTCALTTVGGVKCWGNNDFGQLGNGTTAHQLTPTNVSGLSSGVQAISAGRFHTCAVMTSGGVRCWGDNESGQLGDGTTQERHTPVNVSGFASGGLTIAAGGSHTCARTTGGAVRCWGSNSWGQLGNGTFTSSAVPVAVSGLGSGVIAVATGDSHSCAASQDNRTRCWGDNGYGQLGTSDSTPNHTTPAIVMQSDTIFAGVFE